MFGKVGGLEGELSGTTSCLGVAGWGASVVSQKKRSELGGNIVIPVDFHDSSVSGICNMYYVIL